MTKAIVPVILSGGSGTRLWPLSRPERPKQFLPLVGERSLFQETVRRLAGLDAADPIVICNEQHRFLVGEALRELDAAAQAIVLEPSGRNTAPAVAVAAMLATENLGPEEGDPLLLVLPADHVIGDSAAFLAAVRVAAEAAADGFLVTFGVVPDRPETGFGYLRIGESRGDWSVLAEFVEKPDLDTAKMYLNSGRYLWNSGMFVLPAARYLSELNRFAPAMIEACSQAVTDAAREGDFLRLGDAFNSSPSDSIDYAVMEKTSHAAAVPLDAAWSDVGSWPALFDALEKDVDGNVLRGDVQTDDCSGCYVVSSERRIGVSGLRDIIVVETAGAVLVSAMGSAQAVKKFSGSN